MGRITRQTIDRIFETARVEEVVGEFVHLKRAGSNYKALSPFTDEKTPSFFVSPSKQIYKCFSSGKGGTVVSFLMEHEHFTYPEALRYLAKKYGIEIEEEEQSEEEQKEAGERENLYVVSEFASAFFQQQLWESETGRNVGLAYLRERGFGDEVIKEFQLGYSPDGPATLLEEARKKTYNEEYLEKAGLIVERNGKKVDRFRSRVIFPIQSLSGRVLGFGGRIMRSDVKAPKYLNSPETDIYHKSKILYGLHQSRSHIIREDKCLLTEGYTDVLSLWQSGIKNSVASSGTSLTVEQIRLIKRLTENVTVLYDGDEAGIQASFRGTDLLLEEGLKVKIVLLPDGEDPDSYAQKHSRDEFNDFIRENEKDFVRFKLDILQRESGDDPLKKAQLVRDMVQSIAAVPDDISREYYVRECARLMDLDEKVVFGELAQNLQKKRRESERQHRRENRPMEVVDDKREETGESSGREADARVVYRDYIQERDLLWVMLNYGNKEIEFPGDESPEGEEEPAKITDRVTPFILHDLESDGLQFEYPVFREIYGRVLRAFKEGERIVTGEDLVRDPDQQLVETVTDLITEKYRLSDWSKKDVYITPLESRLSDYTREAVLRFKEHKVRKMIEDLRNEMKEMPGEEEHKKSVDKLMKLSLLRQRINQNLNRVV